MSWGGTSPIKASVTSVTFLLPLSQRPCVWQSPSKGAFGHLTQQVYSCSSPEHSGT